jgi:hypothetical protein
VYLTKFGNNTLVGSNVTTSTVDIGDAFSNLQATNSIQIGMSAVWTGKANQYIL